MTSPAATSRRRPRRRCRPSVEHALFRGRSAAPRSRASAAPRPAAAARTAGPHRRRRRRAGRRSTAYGPAGRVAERDLTLVERQPELLGRDLRHRRRGAGADVLHRGDRPVARRRSRARTHGIRGRTAAAVPDLARHARRRASTVARARARTSSPALPVRLGAAVALHQVLRRVRRRRRSSVRVVEAPQLERVDVELRRELVEQRTRARTSPRRSPARGTPSSAAC